MLTLYDFHWNFASPTYTPLLVLTLLVGVSVKAKLQLDSTGPYTTAQVTTTHQSTRKTEFRSYATMHHNYQPHQPVPGWQPLIGQPQQRPDGGIHCPTWLTPVGVSQPLRATLEPATSSQPSATWHKRHITWQCRHNKSQQ